MCEEHSEFSPLRIARVESRRPHRRMEISTIRRVVSELAPLGLKELIPSTMGEPLLYRNFQDIIVICKEFGVKLNLTTNGTWPGLGADLWGRLICPVASDIKVSWNGVTPSVQEGIMKGTRLEKRVNDLKAFLQVRDEVAASDGNRATVTLQCTFMETNLHELPALVRFASDIGADRVKGHHLWVHFNEMKGEDMRRSPEVISKWNIIVSECHEAADLFRRTTGRSLRLQNFTPISSHASAQSADETVCPFLGREAWVNHKGRFDPCCAPDAERKSLGEFGDVLSQEGILGIWNGEKYRSLLKEYVEQPLCRKCTMRRPKEELMEVGSTK